MPIKSSKEKKIVYFGLPFQKIELISLFFIHNLTSYTNLEEREREEKNRKEKVVELYGMNGNCLKRLSNHTFFGCRKTHHADTIHPFLRVFHYSPARPVMPAFASDRSPIRSDSHSSFTIIFFSISSTLFFMLV